MVLGELVTPLATARTHSINDISSSDSLALPVPAQFTCSFPGLQRGAEGPGPGLTTPGAGRAPGPIPQAAAQPLPCRLHRPICPALFAVRFVPAADLAVSHSCSDRVQPELPSHRVPLLLPSLLLTHRSELLVSVPKAQPILPPLGTLLEDF